MCSSPPGWLGDDRHRQFYSHPAWCSHVGFCQSMLFRGKPVDSSILAIMAEYKRRFGQEAVLRVVRVGRASF